MHLCSDCFFTESASNKDESLLFIVFPFGIYLRKMPQCVPAKGT